MHSSYCCAIHELSLNEMVQMGSQGVAMSREVRMGLASARLYEEMQTAGLLFCRCACGLLLKCAWSFIALSRL